MQNDSIPTWLLIQAFVFIINNTEDKIIGLSPFETIYLRGNKFPSNVPSLSISKLKSYKPFTNEFYKTAIEILSKVKQKQLRKISEVEKVKMYDINVVVIIKSYRVSGKSDKIRLTRQNFTKSSKEILLPIRTSSKNWKMIHG